MRNRIMRATSGEMHLRGVKFTMSDVANSVGISKRSLYEYFSSKEDLIGAIVDDRLAELRQKCNDIINNEEYDLTQKFKKILLIQEKNFDCGNGRGAEDIKRYYPLEWKKVEDFIEERWGLLQKILQDGIEEGCFRPVYLPVVKKMIKGAINEIIDYNFLVYNQVSLNEMFENMADVLLFGLVEKDERVLR